MNEQPKTATSACPHQEAVGQRWGDPISEERQAKLQGYLDRWAMETDHGNRRGPFDGVSLNGADVGWLAEYVKRNGPDPNLLQEGATLHLEGAILSKAHLEGFYYPYTTHLEDAKLWEAHLEGASLTAHFEHADLANAHLERTFLAGPHLEGAILRTAFLENANLSDAHLEGAIFSGAHLDGAILRAAHMEGANFVNAHLEGAVLVRSHLEGRRYSDGDADLLRIRRWKSEFPSVLPPADLRSAFFDRATVIAGATLGDADLGFVRVADTRWGEVNLAVVDWGDAPTLQDELAAKTWQPPRPKPVSKRPSRRERQEAWQKQHVERLDLYRAAVRANRQLATVLRSQGLNDDADKFAYRAQVLQRTVLRVLGRRLSAAFSWLLDLISGYGYEPFRSVIAYVVIILFFAGLYLINSQFAAPHLRWDEALVLSISSFHGRGFFTSGISLGDNLARLAAGEAIVGLLIEITFIATFTQRFFAR